MIEKPLIQTWLREAELEYEELERGEDAEDGGFRWGLVFKSGNYRTVVAHHDVDFNWLWLEVSLTITDEHAEALRSLDEDTRDRFVFDLRLALLNQPVGQRIVFSEQEPKIPELFSVGTNLMEDPLPRSVFFHRNHQVQTAAIIGAQMFRKLARFQDWP